ncbi:MAG: guanylate kinase [Planctomycetes bacterium]|nr:guanylate kinase [Planctomycetota bacterium]
MSSDDGACGKLIVISGPSGAGKPSICNALLKQLPDAVWSVSVTTRSMRPGEQLKGSYEFVTREEFERRMVAGEFLESAEYVGERYGTPGKPVVEALGQGQIVVMEIDVQGGMQIRQSMPDALLIFIKPPSEEVLLTRLRGRGRDDEQAIQCRYAEARSEIENAESSRAYDAFVINDDLETAIEEICDIIRRRGNIG